MNRLRGMDKMIVIYTQDETFIRKDADAAKDILISQI